MGGGVLIVDDDSLFCEALARIFVGEGLVVRVASGVAEARRALAEFEDIAVVVADLNLPDGTGLELLEWTHAERPTLGGVLITGARVDSIVDRLAAMPRFGLVRKPMKAEQILSAVRKGMEDRRR